jgi:mono/diheme cytochrome c family protein
MSGSASVLGRIAAGACLTIIAGCARTPASQPETAPEPVVAEAPVITPESQVDTVALQDVLIEGRKIYHGQGLCYGCHGGRLQGGPVAPPLVGPKRDPADSSFAFILHVIRAGAPHTPMVNNQGGIDAGQVVQVANYVWAVSNGKSVP